MSEPFLGEIKIFAGNFAPRSYAFCNGQLLPISQNTALFSLLGTTYGGDGRTTFGLPNLQGRIPVHQGQGPGLTRRRLGEHGGVQTVTLSHAQMPNHTHTADPPQLRASTGAAHTSDPRSTSIASADLFSSDSLGAQMNDDSISDSTSNAGGSQTHSNMPPYLVTNFIIALQGIYPSRA